MNKVGVILILVFLAGCVGPTDYLNIKRVYKETDAPAVDKCDFRGIVTDDDMQDLLKKSYKIGGDTVVMKPVVYKDYLRADVYRCEK